MNKSTVWWIAGTVGLLGIIGFFAYDLKKKAKSAPDAGTDPYQSPPLLNQAATTVTNAVSSVIPNVAFPLKKGSKGKQVGMLQAWLNSEYNSKLTVDNDFGPKTLTAVINMQQNPNSQAMQQYITMGLVSSGKSAVTSGQVSEDFYKKFITKTESASNNDDFNLGNFLGF